MQILEKRTSESVHFDIDCDILLSPGETITSVTSVTATPATTPPIAFGTAVINGAPITYTDAFGSTRIVAAGLVIQVVISGGFISPGAQIQLYTVRAIFTTSIGNTVEATVYLRLNDTPAQ